MKKFTLLHSEISAVIAQMGHTDTLTIADCGLPIRGTPKRIDLALCKGVPGFLKTLDTILSELCVQQAYFAEEIRDKSPQLHEEILKRLGDEISVTYISHEKLKKHTETSRAVIRTGECTPFANIILVSGVTFLKTGEIQ